MILDVFRGEWVRLRRPALLGGTYGAISGVTVIVTIVLFAAAASPASGTGNGPRAATQTLASLATAGGMVRGLATSATLFGVLALAVTAAQVAGDYPAGTLRNLLARQPRRLVLLAGKAAALAAFLAGAITCATLAAVAAAFAMAPARSLDTSAWTSASGLASLGSTYGNVLLSVLGYGALGFGLAVALRSPAWSIAAGIAWLLPVETILAATVQHSARFLPGQLLAAIASGGTSTVGYARALELGLPYASAALAIAAVLFSRRDVTS
jgi:ABC-2 type transport system permease protein